MKFLDAPPRFVFFTGKGGVGKTSIACAAAIHLARAGKRVLLVSTDPASNVGQVFGLTIGNTITDVLTVPGLSALEIDPEQAADAYRERIVGPVRGLLPKKELPSITEQLSGSCTTEIASFNEFTALLTDHDTVAGFDHVLFDTAPTGHTIRLLHLPGSWTDFLDDGKGDASCLGPMSGLEKQRSIYADAVAALADPRRTRLVLVSRAQQAPLAEIARTHTELADIGLTRQHVVINGVLPAPTGGGRRWPPPSTSGSRPRSPTCPPDRRAAARPGRAQGHQHGRRRRTRGPVHHEPRHPAAGLGARPAVPRFEQDDHAQADEHRGHEPVLDQEHGDGEGGLLCTEGAEDRGVDGDVVGAVGDGDGGDTAQPGRHHRGFTVTVVAQTPDQSPDPQRQGQQPEQPDPVLGHYHQSQGGDHADRDQGDQAEVLAGDDLPRPRPALAGGGDEQHGQHHDVVDVGAGEHRHRRGDGADHPRTRRLPRGGRISAAVIVFR